MSDIASLNNSATNQTVEGFTNGDYNWNITCWDNVNNTNTSQTRSFTIDTTAPSIILNQPANDTWQTTQPVTFNYTVTGSNLDACVLYGDFSGSWTKNQTNSSPTSASPDTITLT